MWDPLAAIHVPEDPQTRSRRKIREVTRAMNPKIFFGELKPAQRGTGGRSVWCRRAAFGFRSQRKCFRFLKFRTGQFGYHSSDCARFPVASLLRGHRTDT